MQDKKASRAKQFLMFDSLKGFRDCLKQKERIVVEPKMLMDDALEELDRKIKEISVGDVVSVMYYDQGQYIQVTGLVSEIDLEYKKYIQIVKKVIYLHQIYQINE